MCEAHSFTVMHTLLYIFYTALKILLIKSWDALEKQGKKQRYRYRSLKIWKSSDGNLDLNLTLPAKKATVLWLLRQYFYIFFSLRKH